LVIDPIREHEKFIEAVVDDTSSLGARLVREEGIYSRAPDCSDLNGFVARLSPADRELLAQMLEGERRSAIFDVLARLHEACAVDGWRLSKDGIEIPHEPYGYTMFEEYVTILDDERGWSALK
jgi:hypothetical protein